MPYLSTAQSFLEQSRLLISARPTTTRITTKYTLPKKPSPEISDSKTSPLSSSKSSQPHTSQAPKATLTLKTYDPISGTCLKYKTDKAAEVGRLVAALGNCGRVMAALPDKEEEVEERALDSEAPVKGESRAALKGVGKEAKIGQVPVQGQHKGGDKGGGGGGGKKKRGK